MTDNDAIISCRLVGGPFDRANTEEFIGMQTIMMNPDSELDSERGDRYATNCRPHPDVFTGDGRTVFRFDTVADTPAE
jgi:hypothetical protein